MAIEKLDARAERWPRPWRWLYVAMKWQLVVLGAACLLYSWGRRMGWSAALWFALFPLAYGIWQGISVRSEQSAQRSRDQELP